MQRASDKVVRAGDVRHGLAMYRGVDDVQKSMKALKMCERVEDVRKG